MNAEQIEELFKTSDRLVGVAAKWLKVKDIPM